MVHFEFCASTTHAMNQCRALDALADRMDRTSFRVNEPLRDREEVEEVELEETSEREELGEEDQVDATIVMRKAKWLEIIII
jgi:L-amino acid N-acyltransferase YncA